MSNPKENIYESMSVRTPLLHKKLYHQPDRNQ